MHTLLLEWCVKEVDAHHGQEAETEKNTDKSGSCDVYVTCDGVR